MLQELYSCNEQPAQSTEYNSVDNLFLQSAARELNSHDPCQRSTTPLTARASVVAGVIPLLQECGLLLQELYSCNRRLRS